MAQSKVSSEEHTVPVVRLIRLFTSLKVTLTTETRKKTQPLLFLS